MRFRPLAAALAATALLASCATPSSSTGPMSFFVTSAGSGRGADLGGLAGADALCQRLATAAGAGGRTWRAYLSTPPTFAGANTPAVPAVNARDRIGKGPWYNAWGVLGARNLEHLQNGNNLSKDTALDERGGGFRARPAYPRVRLWPDAAEALLRAAYAYRDGGTAWDAFPEEWRRAGRENARAALWDFRNSIGNYPSPTDLATVKVPVVCSYGARSPKNIARLTRSLAAAISTSRLQEIEGAGHAAPFDATSNFVNLVGDTIDPERRRTFG